MTQVSASTANPIELLEDCADDQDWSHERLNDRELLMEARRFKSDMLIHWMWSEDLGALALSVPLPMTIPKNRRTQALELLCAINESLWLGHFSMTDGLIPTYQYTMLVGGPRASAKVSIEELVETVFEITERYFQAFQYIAWGDKSPSEAVTIAMLDTIGEA